MVQLKPDMLELMEKTDLRVRLAPGLKQRFDGVVDSSGMSQVSAVNRIVEWFCSQDEVTRAVVLGSIPESVRPDIARMLLERMVKDRSEAGEKSAAVRRFPPPDAVRKAIDAADRPRSDRRGPGGEA